jgi:branched-subunit amino acid transport protein
MTAWIALLVASILTLALSAGPSLLNRGVAVPAVLQHANRFVPPALLGALAGRSVATQAAATGGIPTLAAVALAVPIALRTRSMAVTITVGSAAYLLAGAVTG